MFFPFVDKVSQELFKLKSDIENDYMQQRMSNLTCKYCNTTLQDFLDTGFVGCMHCYSLFKEHAKNLALDIHGKIGHVGKMPKQELTKASKKRELERLIREKDIAVQKEEYILADELKAKIARLREELKW